MLDPRKLLLEQYPTNYFQLPTLFFRSLTHRTNEWRYNDSPAQRLFHKWDAKYWAWYSKHWYSSKSHHIRRQLDNENEYYCHAMHKLHTNYNYRRNYTNQCLCPKNGWLYPLLPLIRHTTRKHWNRVPTVYEILVPRTGTCKTSNTHRHSLLLAILPGQGMIAPYRKLIVQSRFSHSYYPEEWTTKIFPHVFSHPVFLFPPNLFLLWITTIVKWQPSLNDNHHPFFSTANL